MKIWVDADACPGAVKDIVERTASRRSVHTVFVANKEILLLLSPYLTAVKVGAGLDVADRYITEQAQPNDLVISQDILLASHLVPMGVTVIDPRGQVFSEENIGERVSVRNLMTGLRETGAVTGGPKQFGEKEKRNFANTFDRELTRLLRLDASRGLKED